MPFGVFGNQIVTPDDENLTENQCAEPPVEGATTDYPLFVAGKFITHWIYYPGDAADAGQGVVDATLSANQLLYISARLLAFANAQAYLMGLPALTAAQKPQATHYLIPVDFTFTVLYKVVAWPAGWLPGYKVVTISPAKWVEVAAAFRGMDCAQSFMRTFVGEG